MRRREGTITMTVNTGVRQEYHDDSNHEEDSALLGSDTTLDPNDDPEAEGKARRMRRWTIALIVCLILAVDLPSVLQSSPMLRIVEDIFCKQHYSKNDPSGFFVNGVVDEKNCKIDSVQAEVAFLKGWLSFFDHLPGLFLAIPFGMLADKYGRKWLLVLNIAQIQLRAMWMYLVLSFPDVIPIRFIWLEAALGLLGGGSMVATALLFVIVSDVTPSSQTASTFFRLGAANFLCFLIAPPLAAKLMEMSPWIPYTLGICVQAFAIPITMALPETLNCRKPRDPTPPTPMPFSKEEACEAERPLTASEPSFGIQSGSFLCTLRTLVVALIANSAFLFKDWRIVFFMCTYPIRMLMSPLEGLLLQYVSKRYHWTFAHVTYISSFQAGLSMVTLLFLLPYLSTYLLKKRGLNVARKDLFLARIAVSAIVIGTFVTGFAPTIFILFVGVGISSFGSGAGSATRALMTSWVQPNEVARLYTALTIVETVGLTAGGPVVAWLFKMAMEHAKTGGSDMWLGVPFFVVGGLLGVVVLLMWAITFVSNKPPTVETGLMTALKSATFVVGDDDDDDDEREKSMDEIRI